MPTYQAMGYITLTIVVQYEADSLETAERMAYEQLDREADESRDSYYTSAIEDIEVELVEQE